MIKNNKNFAFTLAEVLITLAIIGIVAAITIPSLVQKYQEKARVTALKKFYATITQAVQMAIIEHGTPDMWGISREHPEVMLTTIFPYIKHAKYCNDGNSKCHTADKLYMRNGDLANVGNGSSSGVFNGGEGSGRAGMQLADGMIVGIFANMTAQGACSISLGTGNLTNICGEYIVDINGSSKPNTYGKDLFIFNLTKSGTVVPVGARNYTSTGYNFENSCLSDTGYGWGCAAWVIENENMDYWHCDDLSWDGKHKCSK